MARLDMKANFSQGDGMEAGRRAVAIGCLLILAVGCAEQEREAAERGRAAGAVIRAPIITEMRTILRDVRMAQVQARTARGTYVGWDELRGHMGRSVPEGYRLEIGDVGPEAYRAEVVHERSGLRCRIEEGPTGSRGPDCT